MPSLTRVSDREGFAGARSEAWFYDGINPRVIKGDRPIIGCCMLVGTVTAGTYSSRDWWLTTEIIEILEDREDYVKFKTRNSIYEWRS